MNIAHRLNLSSGLAQLVLAIFLLTAGVAEAGLLRNETAESVCRFYLGTCPGDVIIPPNGQFCLNAFQDFPVFESSEGLRCPMPFFTARTTGRFFYERGFPICCRDCITNTCGETEGEVRYIPQGIRLDQDGDGRITRAEFASAIKQDFDQADVNGDNLYRDPKCLTWKRRRFPWIQTTTTSSTWPRPLPRSWTFSKTWTKTATGFSIKRKTAAKGRQIS